MRLWVRGCAVRGSWVDSSRSGAVCCSRRSRHAARDSCAHPARSGGTMAPPGHANLETAMRLAMPSRFGFSTLLFIILSFFTASSPRAAADDSCIVGPNIDVKDVGATFLSRVLAERARASLKPLATSAAPGADIELGGWNESVIAVNPTNPMNIAYASLFELRVSTDGGTTWQVPVPCKLPATHLAQGDPCLAFDSNGRLFWSYLASPLGSYLNSSGIDIFVAQCDPATGAV